MFNPIYEKLAKIAVEYSLEVEKGQEVAITGPVLAKDLFQALQIEILKAGAYPSLLAGLEGSREIFFKYATEEQLLHVNKIEELTLKKFDRYIEIRAGYNTRRLSTVEPQKLMTFANSPERKELIEIFEKRTFKGEMKWVVVPFPCQAFAQEANMDLFSYSDFINKSLFLDKENPVDEWRGIKKKQDLIVKSLNNVDKIHVLGENTDLTLSVKGRKWINCSGQGNLPDGEVFTGPIEDSANGHIKFTYPGIYLGREVENIYLEFKDGKVIHGTAEKGKEVLEEILKIEGANKIGEFAIGTNYGITVFTKNMLFDEKMGGTMHCALGLGIKETGSNNNSTIHWDILKDMKVPGSKILADGTVIYEEGKWKLDLSE